MSSSDNEQLVNKRLIKLQGEYCSLLGLTWRLPSDISDYICRALPNAIFEAILPKAVRSKNIVCLINEKLKVNKQSFKFLIDTAAKRKIYFNPNEKEMIYSFFNCADRTGMKSWLSSQSYPKDLISYFSPASSEESYALFQSQLDCAKVNRSDAREGIQNERREALLRSLFGSWIYSIFPRARIREEFQKTYADGYQEHYIDLLRRHFPKVLHREQGLAIVCVKTTLWDEYSDAEIIDWIANWIRKSYEDLSNHTYLSVTLERPSKRSEIGRLWRVIAATTLFAEKHISKKATYGFFRPDKIQSYTEMHISSLDLSSCDFHFLNYGFEYKDCFISFTGKGDNQQVNHAALLFEKNSPDETIVPCPECYSKEVRGNSYPSFGVKSWECQNPICPARSAFDRGNRFSVQSILKRDTAKDPEAVIPDEIINGWRLDVVFERSLDDILEMLVRHFSIPGDSVKLINITRSNDAYLGRRLNQETSSPEAKLNGSYLDFLKLPFFHRFLYPSCVEPSDSTIEAVETEFDWLTVYHGSCLKALGSMPEGIVDGAVTSPPYYNAREYSTWDNIYTYLFDMKVSAQEVFRVLKPGAIYLFNIFDYFDNEKSIASSDLGKRRMILSAYIALIFENIGFELCGNIAWFKGHIEGKRNFNYGNKTPFFQLPHNAWEHIFVFRKPGGKGIPIEDFPELVNFRPVTKMVRGINMHGHTAPFPDELPDVLSAKLPEGSLILDPFAGSLTTARVAHRNGQRFVGCEIHDEFINLGIRNIENE